MAADDETATAEAEREPDEYTGPTDAAETDLQSEVEEKRRLIAIQNQWLRAYPDLATGKFGGYRGPESRLIRLAMEDISDYPELFDADEGVSIKTAVAIKENGWQRRVRLARRNSTSSTGIPPATKEEIGELRDYLDDMVEQYELELQEEK